MATRSQRSRPTRDRITKGPCGWRNHNPIDEAGDTRAGAPWRGVPAASSHSMDRPTVPWGAGNPPHEPQAKLFRKGKGHLTRLYCMAHVLIEHRQGLPVDVEFTEATGYAERDTGVRLIKREASAARSPPTRPTTHESSSPTAERSVSPRKSPRTSPTLAARRLTRAPRATAAIGSVSASASVSRKRLVGAKTAAPMRKMRVRGFRNASFMTVLTIGCHSLLRVAKLLPQPALVSTAPNGRSHTNSHAENRLSVLLT
jgi:hypothetical protein